MLAYCDYIASLIGDIKASDREKILASVGPVKRDFWPSGALRSTAKTIEVEDRFGKRYKITVEEA